MTESSSDQPLLHIIYTRRDEMIISRKQYAHWRDIQDEYEFYMASLGPWSLKDVLDFLVYEYSKQIPDAADRVHAFLASGAEAAAI